MEPYVCVFCCNKTNRITMDDKSPNIAPVVEYTKANPSLLGIQAVRLGAASRKYKIAVVSDLQAVNEGPKREYLGLGNAKPN